jgi:hypothetical protein
MGVHLTLLGHAATSAVCRVGFPLDEPIDPQATPRHPKMAADFRRMDAAWKGPAVRARHTVGAARLNAAIEPVLQDIRAIERRGVGGFDPDPSPYTSPYGRGRNA